MDLKEIKDEIASRITIAQLAGSHNNRIQCPFHGSEDADLALYHEDNRWKCWGACGTGGDIFSWVMHEQGLDFMGALRYLADLAGITLKPNRERTDVLVRAQAYYHDELLKNPKVLKYLHGRGFSDEHIFRMQLGWADERTYPEMRISDLNKVGLVEIGSNGGHYPWFRNRIIYPIYDRDWNQVQMQGRLFPSDLEGPKYMAMKQNVELKGRSIFECLAGEEILRDRDLEEVFLGEGWPDRETLHAWRIPALGLFGHSGLAKHAYKFKRLKRLYVVLDPDEASQKNILSKLYELALLIPHVEIRNVFLQTNGLDLNDWGRQGKAEGKFFSPTADADKIEQLWNMAHQAPHLIDNLIRVWGKDDWRMQSILHLIAKQPDPEPWIFKVAKHMGVSTEAIHTCIRILRPKELDAL